MSTSGMEPTMKVGQLPSLADLQLPQIEKYRPVLADKQSEIHRVVFQLGRCAFHSARSNSTRFIYNPMSRSCMTHEREKHSVLRAKRFKRVRNVRCLRSIFCIVSFPTVCCSGGRCR